MRATTRFIQVVYILVVALYFMSGHRVCCHSWALTVIHSGAHQHCPKHHGTRISTRLWEPRILSPGFTMPTEFIPKDQTALAAVFPMAGTIGDWVRLESRVLAWGAMWILVLMLTSKTLKFVSPRK